MTTTDQKQIVLAVDDEKSILEVLSEALKGLGFVAITAENGYEALEIAKNQKVDLIITDICMPIMDGIELLREIRKFDSEIPIILITGYDPDQARQAAKTHRANALLIKPFRMLQLKKAISSVMSLLN